MIITIKTFDGINHTPAVELLARAQYELIRDRLVFPNVLMFWDDQAIVGFLEDQPVGVISFSNTSWTRTVDIKLGYVIPEHRKLGVYRAMWEALVVKAQELKASQIVSTTHINNAPMLATSDALGRQRTGYVLRYMIAPKVAE